jgi:crotonobetainyl-CoA:carnitine CoA-transferase CaiB-like acyl-CoA transferase
MISNPAPGPLAGLRVLDLSRVLAGPWASQMLGDLGAEILKIEQPGVGDDTRRWGPPFVPDGSNDSAYYLCCNRNKQSLAIDIGRSEGAELVRRLAAGCDIVIENFRVGGLAKYGLDYESLSANNRALIYCSITGFGQTGPYKDRGGYDFLIQGMSGLMSVTGRREGEPGDGPLKVGIPVSDLFTGLYATVAILAALNHRNRTGEGQHIDCALLDSQVSLMSNQASNYLNGGVVPRGLGNQHPNVVPYQDFATADGNVLVALGNDRQFRDFCRLIGREDLGNDVRFADTAGRSANRDLLIEGLSETLLDWQSDDLLAQMEKAKLPGGPVNRVDEILADPQVVARELIHTMHRDDGTPVKVLGFPVQLSRSPATFRRAPPRMGQDTQPVLQEVLAIDDAGWAKLLEAGIVAGER